MTESYSMWDAPTSFVDGGGSMYTFLDGGAPAAPAPPTPQTQNTIAQAKTGSNDDVKKRLESIQKQRESEFSGVTRK
jgi:hypothetical protein